MDTTITAATTGVNLENVFLENLCQARKPVSIFLVNGIRLQGVIAKFDETSILLESASRQIVYKHAVSTILANAE